MNEKEVKRFIAEAMKNSPKANKPQNFSRVKSKSENQKMQFSKKLMIFSCVIYACTWIVTMTSWFFMESYSEDLKSMATWLFGASLAFYEAKSAIENKTRINAEAKIEIAHHMHSEDFEHDEFGH
jgi:chaperonin GroEL (HSP60 family)